MATLNPHVRRSWPKWRTSGCLVCGLSSLPCFPPAWSLRIYFFWRDFASVFPTFRTFPSPALTLLCPFVVPPTRFVSLSSKLAAPGCKSAGTRAPPASPRHPRPCPLLSHLSPLFEVVRAVAGAQATSLSLEGKRGEECIYRLLVISSPVWNDSLTFWLRALLGTLQTTASECDIFCPNGLELDPGELASPRLCSSLLLSTSNLVSVISRADSAPRQKLDTGAVIKVKQQSFPANSFAKRRHTFSNSCSPLNGWVWCVSCFCLQLHSGTLLCSAPSRLLLPLLVSTPGWCELGCCCLKTVFLLNVKAQEWLKQKQQWFHFQTFRIFFPDLAPPCVGFVCDCGLLLGSELSRLIRASNVPPNWLS